MIIKMLYFSGTGNTELIAHKIAETFKRNGRKVDLISIENDEAIHRLDFTNSIVGFGFPVYKLTYPVIFNTLIQTLNKKADNTPYFIFSSYTRFNGSSLKDFQRKLDNKKFIFICKEKFKCPSCGISARLDENDFEYKSVMFFEDNIQKKIENFVSGITKTRPSNLYYLPSNPIKKIIHKIVSNIELTKYPKLQIDYSKCTTCGMCAKKCPDSNYTLTESAVNVIDNKDCLHCLRCMHHCPANAISFGKLTQGENRYTFKIRNTLYETAAAGSKNPYWPYFDRIVSRWRRRTLAYWLRHRKNPEI